MHKHTQFRHAYHESIHLDFMIMRLVNGKKSKLEIQSKNIFVSPNRFARLKEEIVLDNFLFTFPS